jgi:hypothetical protein
MPVSKKIQQVFELEGGSRMSRKNSKKGSKKSSRKVSRKSSRKVSRKSSRKGSKKNSKRIARKIGSKKGSRRGSRRGSRKNKQTGGVFQPIQNEIGDTTLYQKCNLKNKGCKDNNYCKSRNKSKKYCNLVIDKDKYNLKSCQCTEHKNEKTLLESASELLSAFLSGQKNKGEIKE